MEDVFASLESVIVELYRPLSARIGEPDRAVRHRNIVSLNANWPVDEARDVMAYLLMEDHDWSTPRVAARLDRDPSSVLRMHERVRTLLSIGEYETERIVESVRYHLAQPEDGIYVRRFKRRYGRRARGVDAASPAEAQSAS